tara:strand:- start:200 stop:397 length:198 start_codon:yes stop_codon:yes gene_type:complete
MSLIDKFQNQGSQLDGSLNGQLPTAPLNTPSQGAIPINNTFSQGQYLNNLPDGINPDVASDVTGN